MPVNTHGSWVFCGPNIRCECTNCFCCFKILSEIISTGKTTWTGGIGQSNSVLMAYSHCTESDKEQYRERDWHKRKQWVPVPVPVSDQCEHIYVILYFPFGSCISPSSVPMQCEYTLTGDKINWNSHSYFLTPIFRLRYLCIKYRQCNCIN